MRVKLECFGLTDRGKVRRLNEDQFLIADLVKSMKVIQSSLPTDDHDERFGIHHGKLLVVADGMGGVAGGEVASGLAVETVLDYVLNAMPWFFRVKDNGQEELESELRTALEECQRRVAATAAETRMRRMGTTLTMAYLLWPRVTVVHAGDSRCYLFRNGRGHRITRDHTVAQQMVDRGIMSAEEAGVSRWNHALWNCIGGGSDEIEPDVYQAALEPGDTLLLCTDGLSKYMDEADILRHLSDHTSAEDAARALVAAANEAGGDDNVTVIVAQMVPVSGGMTNGVDATAYLPAV
jgi:protein phosphatase